MARWAPDARQRLQEAGIDLLREHGYDAVTIAEIAARAGLTRRTFFNHFDDKRDLLFAGAQDLQDTAVRFVEDAAPTLSPFDTALDAFARAGGTLARLVPFEQERRTLIDSSQALQERDLVKAAALVTAVAAALQRRGAPADRARLAAATAHEVFRVAYSRWSTAPDHDFGRLMERTAHDLRAAMGNDAVPPPG
jgi:AcrR family transcriptional regulator